MSGADVTFHAGALPATLVEVDLDGWRAEATRRQARGENLLALVGSDERDRQAGYAVVAAYLSPDGLALVRVQRAAEGPWLPSLAGTYACAGRLERALRDLVGIRIVGEAVDTRPWLRHAAWADDAHPLRREPMPAPSEDSERYPFVRVEGDGVHEIAVGPVHAGIIEPGHFRFSVVGEKVLRLEQRLGYVHKGIERRFTELPLAQGHRLAARVSGDSAVAYSWAYCMALESIAGCRPSPRALALRAFALERERIANHLGDLGALGNDAGFAFGLAQFSRLKETLLRVNGVLAGQRYWLDQVVPGGVAFDLDDNACATVIEQSRELADEVQGLRAIYGDHAGVQDRFVACGVIGTELARRLGVLGLPARASGIAFDLRADLPAPPYDTLAVQRAGHADGDVAARVSVRFDEVLESLRVCAVIAESLPGGALREPVARPEAHALGVGLVEGWRGPVYVHLEAGADGGIRRCHPHDPSWQNWPALEHAVIGNIVPDFPLINKSLNLSYSGQDL